MRDAGHGSSEIIAASLTLDLKRLSSHGPCLQRGDLFHEARSEFTVILSLAPLKEYAIE